MGAAVGDFTGEVSLGDDGSTGTAKFSGGTYTITASGSDIWNNSDGLYWIYKEISGNWMITWDSAWDEANCLRSTAAANDWRKMGLMLRVEPEEAGSVNVMALLNNAMNANLQYRSEKDGASAELSGSAVAKGSSDTDTLRLIRAGNNFTLLRKRTDGSFHSTHALSFPADMPTKVYYGFALTAHDTTNIEAAKFSNLKVDPIAIALDASRTLPQTTFLPGSVVNDIILNVTVETGKTADVVVTETLPTGWSIKTSNPAVTKMDGQKAIWELKGVSGIKKITYSVSCGTDREGVSFSGMVSAAGTDFGISGGGGLDLEGADQAWAPKLAKTTKLDGKISTGEYDGAYSFHFDRTNDRAPGVLLEGSAYTFEQSHDVVYIFHNDTHINVAIEVIDPSLQFEQATGNTWEDDSTELYIDGNYDKLSTKENGAYGFQATVEGDGSRAAGNDGPVPVPIKANGSLGASGDTAARWGDAGYNGNASADGVYWNFGARVKDDKTGYIVEYQVDKSQVLDPQTITIIGMDIGMNDGTAGVSGRKGKWAWWHFNADTGGRMDAWNDERGWGKLELLKDAKLPTNVSDWSMF